MTRRQIRVGSRSSALALSQTQQTIERLKESFPDIDFVVQHITTTGDRLLHAPLSQLGGKGVFVKEIEEALLAQHIDFAVHSLKDLPAQQPAGLCIGAYPERADASDAFVSDQYKRLTEMPAGTLVGTSSLRRSALLKQHFPLLEIRSIRGNVDTRIRKMQEGEVDALVLACAGLDRLGREKEIAERLATDLFIPAPGQGCLAIEIRSDDTAIREIVATLDHPPTRAAVAAERAFLATVEGGCQVPVGAHAKLNAEGKLILKAHVSSPDGRHVMVGECAGAPAEAHQMGTSLAKKLIAEGALALLAAK